MGIKSDGTDGVVTVQAGRGWDHCLPGLRSETGGTRTCVRTGRRLWVRSFPCLRNET
jgi:hypothetical protein